MARLIKLDKFADSRGWSLNDIYREARVLTLHNFPDAPSDPVLKPNNFQFNYSIINPGIIKAWHRHKNQDDFFCVLYGMAQVGVYCEATAAAGGNPAKKYFIGEHNPAVVHIKAGEWHGLTPLGDKPCGLLYLVTNLYDPHRPDAERAAPGTFGGVNFWKPENK